MRIQITFNKQSFLINAFPSTLAGAKTTIIKTFNELLPTTNFDLKISFTDRYNRLQTSNISNEAQYKSLLSQVPKTSQTIIIEVVPLFNRTERKDVVTIEDETVGSIYYVDCRSRKAEAPKQQTNRPQTVYPQQTRLNTIPMKTVQSPTEAESKSSFNNVPKTSPTNASTKNLNTSRLSKEPEFVCHECDCKLGRVRYTSTGVADFNLCADCMSEVSHPYAMVEYVDGKATRRFEAPQRRPAYQRPYSGYPYGGYEPRYDYGPSNFPSYGNKSRSGCGNFFSSFGF